MTKFFLELANQISDEWINSQWFLDLAVEHMNFKTNMNLMYKKENDENKSISTLNIPWLEM